MQLKLYHCPYACSRVTMNALEETGLDYDDQVVNLFKGEQKRPEYLAVHPGGKVPALAVDDQVLTENAAILMFLHRVAPAAKLLPAAQTPVAQAQQAADLVWCSGTVHPMVRQVRMAVRFTDGDPTGVQAKGREYLQGVCAQVSERLAGNAWWYGAQWSIVDVYLFWLFSTAASAGFPIGDYANVAGLVERVQERPSFQRAKAREEAAMAAAGVELPA